MGKHVEEKSLVTKHEVSFFYRIKNFFKNLFKNNDKTIQQQASNISNEIQNNKKNVFIESLKIVENEETKLLELQKQFENGTIHMDDLSDKQMIELIELYKTQISELRKSNEARKQKLLQYRKNLQST